MEIYCDSSFDEKRKIAGLGIWIKDGVKQRAISNFIPAPNNNYAEIWAIYLAAILSSGQATIYTDSQTALSYIRNEVKEKPRTPEQYKNHQLMRLMAYKIRRLGVDVQKIKAHEHKYQVHLMNNNIADMLAKQGRSKYYQFNSGKEK